MPMIFTSYPKLIEDYLNPKSGYIIHIIPNQTPGLFLALFIACSELVNFICSSGGRVAFRAALSKANDWLSAVWVWLERQTVVWDAQGCLGVYVRWYHELFRQKAETVCENAVEEGIRISQSGWHQDWGRDWTFKAEKTIEVTAQTSAIPCSCCIV